MNSNFQIHVFRLRPHEDLKNAVLKFAQANGISAGIILTCVGSLEQYHLRFADQKSGQMEKGFYEIVSLTGTFSEQECHFHLSIADGTGKVIGGHVLQQNLIYTTAEIAVAHLTDKAFHREPDDPYGFHELVIKEKAKS
jgi:uncharacterized protein